MSILVGLFALTQLAIGCTCVSCVVRHRHKQHDDQIQTFGQPSSGNYCHSCGFTFDLPGAFDRRSEHTCKLCEHNYVMCLKCQHNRKVHSKHK